MINHAICFTCGKRTDHKPQPECSSIKHREHYIRAKGAQRKRQAKIRVITLLAYGGKCACCGFSDLGFRLYSKGFLQIDHKAGGGNIHRRTLFGGTGTDSTRFFIWLRNRGYPEGYRVLCAGCNAAMSPNSEKCILHGFS